MEYGWMWLPASDGLHRIFVDSHLPGGEKVRCFKRKLFASLSCTAHGACPNWRSPSAEAALKPYCQWEIGWTTWQSQNQQLAILKLREADVTPRKINMSLAKWCLEDYFPFEMASNSPTHSNLVPTFGRVKSGNSSFKCPSISSQDIAISISPH